MIGCIEGDPRTGKTITIVYFLYCDYDIDHQPIFANFPLKFPYIPIDSIEGLADMKDGSLGMDEFHSWLDCRASHTQQNKLISYIILALGKKRSNLYYSYSRFDMADIRLRNITERRMIPRMLWDKKHGVVVFVDCYRRSLQDSTKWEYSHTFAYKAEPLYDLYDTHSGIFPPKEFLVENAKAGKAAQVTADMMRNPRGKKV